MIPVLLAIDDESLAVQVSTELTTAGLEVLRPSPADLSAALERADCICVADRAAAGDRGVLALRRARAAGIQAPFIFIDPRLAARERPPWLGRRVHEIDPYRTSALVERVRAYARRLSNTPSDLLEKPTLDFGRVVLDTRILDCLVDDRAIGLTPAQFALLYHLAASADRFHSSAQLYRDLFGRSYTSGDKHVAYMVNRIRAKAGEGASDASLVENRRGVGYRFRPPF